MEGSADEIVVATVLTDQLDIEYLELSPSFEFMRRLGAAEVD